MGCAEYLLMATAMQTILREYTGEIGRMGEALANEFVRDHLNLQDTGFQPAYHGLDGVFRDSDRNLVVVDSKCTTSNNPFALLDPLKSGDKQLGRSWIESRASLMQNPNSEQCKAGPNNSAIGREIQNALSKNGPGVRSMLVHTNPETQEITAYELVGEDPGSQDNWEPVGYYTED